MGTEEHNTPTTPHSHYHHHHRKKKSRSSSSKLEVHMDLLPPKQEPHLPPFVAYFPTGFDPLASQTGCKKPALETGEGEQDRMPQTQVFSNTEKFKNRQQQLVLRSQGNVDFVGTNYSGEGAAWQPCSYLLGVFDRESGSLKLVPIAGGKIFRMEPRVAGVDYGSWSQTDELKETKEATADTMREKKKLLLSTFGTRKSRLRLQRRERGIVKEEALGSAKEIEELLLDASQNALLMTSTEVLEQASAAAVRGIPPYDVLATSSEKAYPLDKIITQEDWNSLNIRELMQAARNQDMEEKLRKEKGYSNFILNRLYKLRIEGDTQGNERRGHIMLFLQHLLAFFNTPQYVLAHASDPWGSTGMFQDANAVDIGRQLGMPPNITAKLLKLFTTNVKGTSANTWRRQRSREHMNLLISYILVLGLKVDNFEMDPYDLAVELKMTISQIRPYFLELGCKFETLKVVEKVNVDASGGKWKYKVTLPVPLQFPKLSVPRPKRKR